MLTAPLGSLVTASLGSLVTAPLGSLLYLQFQLAVWLYRTPLPLVGYCMHLRHHLGHRSCTVLYSTLPVTPIWVITVTSPSDRRAICTDLAFTC